MIENTAANGASEHALVDMLTGAWVTQLVAAVARMGIPDLLAAAGGQSSEALARSLGADAEALRRVMRAACSVGVFAQVEDGGYVLTELGEKLRSGQPGSMRDFFLAETDTVHRRSWDALVDAICTGEPQPKKVLGHTVFDYYGEHAEDGQQFGRAMQNVSVMSEQGLMRNYDFSGRRRIVDLGGGNGSLLRSILQKNSQASGVVFDLPYMETQAVASIAGDGLGNRCCFESGDFFERVPAADMYLLRFILHDWNDAASKQILQAIRAAANPGARVVIVEMLLPETNEPGFAQLMDINMLVMTGGRERTGNEYGRLLTESGLRMVQTISTGTQFFVVEGEAA